VAPAIIVGMYEPLSIKHTQTLGELILAHAKCARQEPSMRKVIQHHVALLGWRFTADAVNAKSSMVVRDAIKVSANHLHHSRAVCEARHKGSDLTGKVIHEHVVPRTLLAERALDMTNAEDIIDLFTKYSICVLVTPDDDALLRKNGLRKTMPEDWKWGDEPFARYSATGIDIFGPGSEGCQRVP
jgi:hypothetical protein